MDKEDIEWLLSLTIPILWEMFRSRKKPKEKPPRKSKRRKRKHR